MSGTSKWIGGIRIALASLIVLFTATAPVESGGASREQEAAEARDLPAPSLDYAGLLGETTEYGVVAAENERLKLYVNPETTEIAVQDKADGYVWFSNPQDRKLDPIAKAVNKAKLSSQLVISYYDEKGHETFVNSLEESVARKQFVIRKTGNGVRIDYQIGNAEKGLEALPQAIGKERFERLVLRRISDESTRFEVSKRYFYNEEKQVYERKTMPEYVVHDLVVLFESVGYTEEDAKFDNEQNGIKALKQRTVPVFTIPVEYSLEQSNLLVRIPMNEVEETKQYPLHTVQVLGFMGAAGSDKSGYMFVPDGSGALIDLNNGKKSVDPYQVPLYGDDETAGPDRKTQFTQVSRLPVFGIKQGDHSLFGIIEQGDALAAITADTSGRLSSYNTVGPVFTVRSSMPYRFRAGKVAKEVPLFQPLYNGDVAIRYAFLSGASAGYDGMAAYYRDYLVRKHHLQRLKPDDNTPFFLELVGAIDRRRTFLGIPYTSVVPLTTYDQAEQLLERMKSEGVGRFRFMYTGWFDRGVNHGLPASIHLPASLGGEAGFRRLTQFTQTNRIGFYPDVAMLRVYRGGNRFSPSRDGSKTLSGDPVLTRPTDLVTGDTDDRSDGGYYLLSPARLSGIVDSVMSEYKQLGVTGITLRDLAETANSDMNAKLPINRQKSVTLSADNMRKLQDRLGNQIISGGNAYALPFAQSVVNAPLFSSKFSIADEEVPFYAMVLHGYIEYAGMPVNKSRDQDFRTSLLKILESGAGVHYQWFYEQSSAIKETAHNDLYADYYADWLDEALRMYKEADSILRTVQGLTIASHAKLAEGVYRTTFENGTAITVNYNKTAVDITGERLEAHGYRVGGGGQ